MGSQISLLSETVINQIAAGEVVENPASAVKELIENAIDAGSTQIDIEIEEGGLERIQIEDNGSGMDRIDAVLCLKRYATSKLQTVDDLFELRTMGFRGEALAAIASVSRLLLKTATDKEATCIIAEAGAVQSIEPCARGRGTTLEIRSLFYNVPARREFQKSASANTAQVVRTVETLALAHPEINFSLTSQGKVLLRTDATDWVGRIKEILGEDLLSQGIEIASFTPPFRLFGYLAPALHAKKTRLSQYFFLNRRALFSPLISRAVKEGYGTRLSEGLYPTFVLYLEAPPTDFDINVHPQKKEVRFKNEKQIFALIQNAVHQALMGPLPVAGEPMLLAEDLPSFSPQVTWNFRSDLPSHESALFEPTFHSLAVVGSYFLLQEEGGLRLVHLEAAYARLLFDSLSKKQTAQQAQGLLCPIEIPLTRDEKEFVEEWLVEFEKMGISGRLIGKKTVAIDALPEWLPAEDFIPFFALWKEKKDLPTAIHHFSQGVKRKYSLIEAAHLWKTVQKCTNPHISPTGERISTILKSEELRRLFQSSKND